jgi:hypothetical protein
MIFLINRKGSWWFKKIGLFKEVPVIQTGSVPVMKKVFGWFRKVPGAQ